jgi:hypothetical protein
MLGRSSPPAGRKPRRGAPSESEASASDRPAPGSRRAEGVVGDEMAVSTAALPAAPKPASEPPASGGPAPGRLAPGGLVPGGLVPGGLGPGGLASGEVTSGEPGRAPAAMAGPGGAELGGIEPGWWGARRLLRGPLRTLVAGQALGQAADGLAQIAFAQLVVFEVGRGATPARLAGVLAATLLPFTVVGPFAGVLIDRWDRRRMLVVVSWCRAGLAVAAAGVAVARSEPLAYAGVLLLLSSSRFVLAAKGAVLPRTVAASELVTANAVSGIVGMTAAFAGAVVGSLFVSASVTAGFFAATVGYLAAGAMFLRLPDVGGRPTTVGLASRARRVWVELVDGGRAIAQHSEIRRASARLKLPTPARSTSPGRRLAG